MRAIGICAFLTLLLATGRATAQQSTAGASVSASLYSILTAEDPSPMVIEEISVSMESGGSLVIAPGGSMQTSGGVQLGGDGDQSSLLINVSGSGDYVYSVALPDTITIPDDESGQMTITNFTSDPPNTGQLSSGNQSVQLGATINLPKAEEEGSFLMEAEFEVGVSFN